ncbi:MAG: trans-sulfuration enzyme family protein [Candidatus Dormibacteraceae bacterium]
MADPPVRTIDPWPSPAPAGEPLLPPIVAASIFTSDEDQPPGYSYGREGNPTWTALEQAFGGLERGHAVVFASGMAASLALLLALVEDRSRRVVMGDDGYFNIRTQVSRLGRLIEARFVDLDDDASLGKEMEGRPAALWVETPSNPLLRCYDLDRLASTAGQVGAALVVDNTLATPALQRPLDHGATASIYSLTKAASGHSDVVAGAVVTRDQALWDRLRSWRTLSGGILGPFEAWLVLRGLKTLELRVTHQSASAERLARHLDQHPAVRRVHYPALGSRQPFLDAQMPSGCGPMLSFEVAGDAQAAAAVVAGSTRIRPATSFGGVHSTWERRARWPSEVAPESLIRLSVGIEDPALLTADLDRALGVLESPTRAWVGEVSH